MGWRGRVVAITIGVAACVPSSAYGGTYDVFGCMLSDGTRIPAGGWSSTTRDPFRAVTNRCAAGEGLTAAPDPTLPLVNGGGVGWQFSAPADTEITAYALHRSSVTNPVDGRRSALIYHDAPVFDAGALEYAQELCGGFNGCSGWGIAASPLAPVNRYARAGLHLRRVIAYLQCMRLDGGTSCPPVGAPTPRITVHAARVTLSDPHEPAFAVPPAGDLLVSQIPLEGMRTAFFAAEDRGGGLASVGIMVDGRLTGEQPVDPRSKDCRRPYTTPVPCPLSAQGTIRFDTTQIANGVHEIALVLTDAAGNRTLSPPATVSVHNPGAANGARASRFARLQAWIESRSRRRGSSAVVPFRQTRAVAGRLTDESGAPVSGAVLDLTTAALRRGSRTRVLGQVSTDSDGRFRYVLRPGSSRSVTVGYRAFHLDKAPSATATVKLHVRAGISLTVRPKRVSPTGTVKFSGRLIGGPGRAGTQVVIYAVGGRKRDRIPVTTVRANARGQFSYRYRFRNSTSGTTYRFRATLHAQAGYPYATASSRVAALRIK